MRNSFIGVLIFVSCAMVSVAAPPVKLSILHIHADDLRADGIHALGNPQLQTPNLDLLVEKGFTFTHCYTQGSMIGAVCTPSRTMLLSGRSWHHIPGSPGAPANANANNTYLPKVIAAAGYQTWHMGKANNAFTAGINAFATNIKDDATGKGPELDRAHASKRMADKVIEFLQARGPDAAPFYMYLAPPVPHDPRQAEEQFYELYKPSEMKLSAAFLPIHPFDNGEMTVRDEKTAPWPRTELNTKQQLAEYYACISGLDFHVGRIFAQLKQSGQWEHTIIVLTGDNGLSLGEHGLFGKQNLYEFGGMHVPLVIAGPGIAHGRSEALVYLFDLFPTFCQFAGVPVPAHAEGKSLLPIVNGKSDKVRDVLYTGYRDCMRSVRDQRWKLIRYPLVNQTQLFDLKSDPLELKNLAEVPEQSAKVSEMLEVLQKEMSAYGDTFRLTVAHPKPAAWSPPKR